VELSAADALLMSAALEGGHLISYSTTQVVGGAVDNCRRLLVNRRAIPSEAASKRLALDTTTEIRLLSNPKVFANAAGAAAST